MAGAPSLGTGLDAYQTELRAFLRELPRLLAEGKEGKHVLVQGDQVLTVWDTLDDACQAAAERFRPGEKFLVQPIDPRFLSYPWPNELLSRKAE